MKRNDPFLRQLQLYERPSPEGQESSSILNYCSNYNKDHSILNLTTYGTKLSLANKSLREFSGRFMNHSFLKKTLSCEKYMAIKELSRKKWVDHQHYVSPFLLRVEKVTNPISTTNVICSSFTEDTILFGNSFEKYEPNKVKPVKII